MAITDEPWETDARIMFGSTARFRIGVWIATRKNTPFYPSLLAEETGYFASNTVSNNFYHRMVDMGMIERIASQDGRAMWYVRKESAYWDIFRIAAHAFGMETPTGDWQERLKATLLEMRSKLHA